MCLSCNKSLGFVPEDLCLYSLENRAGVWHTNGAGGDIREYKKCRNYGDYGVCNWLVAVDDENDYCISCRLNKIIPNLSEETNKVLWYRIERAKRRLLYTLLRLNLGFESRAEDQKGGLAFQFMENESNVGEFEDNVNEQKPVLTGHNNGIITINIAEADHSVREEIREKMNEAYRTLLGHFRHEIGHYYWTRLVLSNEDFLNQFRNIFGDERTDYQTSIQSYYMNGPPADWQTNYISAYASSHPWEDWAETWANYLHIVDTLETAQHHGFNFGELDFSGSQEELGFVLARNFNQILNEWRRFSVTLNELNRGMGLPDAYPFSLSERSGVKLNFVNQVIQGSRYSKSNFGS